VIFLEVELMRTVREHLFEVEEMLLRLRVEMRHELRDVLNFREPAW